MYVQACALTVLLLWSTTSASFPSPVLDHIKVKVGDLLNGQTEIASRVHVVKGNTVTLLANDQQVFQIFSNLNVTLNAIVQSSTSLEGDGDSLLDGQTKLLANQASLAQGQQTLQNGQATIQNKINVLQQGQADLTAGQAGINTRLGGLEAGQGRIENSLDVLQTGQQRLQTSVETVASTLNNVQSVQNGLVDDVNALTQDAAAKDVTLSEVLKNQGTLNGKQHEALSNQADIRHLIDHIKSFVASGSICKCFGY